MYSCFNGEVFFNGKKMSLTKRELPLKGARSFNHPHQSEIDFFETNKVENALNIGSSLKFAYLISGEIDLYIDTLLVRSGTQPQVMLYYKPMVEISSI